MERSLRDEYGIEVGRRLEEEFRILVRCGFEEEELIVLDMDEFEAPCVMPEIVVRGVADA